MLLDVTWIHLPPHKCIRLISFEEWCYVNSGILSVVSSQKQDILSSCMLHWKSFFFFFKYHTIGGKDGNIVGELEGDRKIQE